MTRHRQSGLTLVEVLVALVVFAVIGVAAFALLDQTLRSDRLTSARLDRLAEVERALQITALDTLQSVPGSLQVLPDGISFLRRGAMGSRVDGLLVAYRVSGDTLTRDIGPPGADPIRQRLLDGLSAATWRFHTPGQDWQTTLPQSQIDGLEMVLQTSQTEFLRRVFVLPQDAPAPGSG